MEKTYERINWENYPSVVTPINEKNLNKMDQALDEVDNRVIGLDTAKLDKSTANTMIKDLEVDETTGIFTITYLNGTVKKVDTGLEKIATNFKYNKDTQKLVLTLTDGTEQEVDLSSLISQYEFTDSDTIAFTIGADGKVKATIKSGSITEDMLQPNFLADVKVEVEKAKTYSNSASNSSNEAKQYRDEAEQFRNEAFSTTPEGYEDLVKNVSDNTVKIDTIIEKAELNIKNNAKGSNIYLTDSADSNVVALELYGKTEQNAYTGKNLLDCSGLTEKTVNGVKFTPVKDDNGNLLYINANGTATRQSTYNITGNTENDTTKDLYVSGCLDGDGGTHSICIIYYDENASWKNESYQTYGSIAIDKKYPIYSLDILVRKDITVNNVKFYPMVSVDGGKYEPYVGGKPSPSPSYPQEIKSVKGKNLLDCRGLTETTINGITFTPVYDENGNLLYINTNGTASANAEFEVKPNLTNTVIDKANSYILSGCPNGGSDTTYRMVYTELDASWGGTGVSNKDYGAGVLLNHTDKVKYSSIRIDIFSGTVCDNLKFYPMIRQASIKDDTYVPYGLLRIKTIGSQLLDVENTKVGVAWNGDVHTARAVVIVPCEPNTTYTFDCDTTVVDGVYYFEKESENDRVATANMPISGVKTITTSANSNVIVIQFNKENITINDVKNTKPMLNKGTIALSWKPYQSTEITLSEPIELNGLNGVYDVVTSEGVTRRFAEVVFDGSDDENITLEQVHNGKSIFTLYVEKETLGKNNGGTHLRCSWASRADVYSLVNKVDYTGSNSHFIRISLDNSIYADVETFKTKLSENPMTVVYELATPTTEALQIDFTALKTFYPETHVSNNADCDMSITYTADAKNYIDNKIALLTTAIYNNI